MLGHSGITTFPAILTNKGLLSSELECKLPTVFLILYSYVSNWTGWLFEFSNISCVGWFDFCIYFAAGHAFLHLATVYNEAIELILDFQIC